MNAWEFAANAVFAALFAFALFVGVVMYGGGERKCSLLGHTWKAISSEKISVFESAERRTERSLPVHFEYVTVSSCERCGKRDVSKKKI